MGIFAELLAHRGVDEVCELRSTFGFMAYHGGSLEEATDVIASRAAAACGASYYGVHQPADLQWHIPSIKVTAADSPALTRFLDHVEVVITVHGFGREHFFTSLWLGGRNRHLAEHVASHVRHALPVYDIVTDLDRIPVELRGQHVDNPVNLPRHAGVQIELPPRVRGSSPLWSDWEGPEPTPHTTALIDSLARAASTWPPSGPATQPVG
jgi:phage replication-related protein YjqB (UPF0714/DUF867 family)